MTDNNRQKGVSMKCIYCNSKDLSVSDIIPLGLTGAKVRRGFVCKVHNGFTNDNYEKRMIAKLSIYRNLIGLTERDGGPVRFFADIDFDGYIIKNVNISDKKSIFGGSRKFSTTDENGKKIVLGKKESLLEIKNTSEDRIENLNLRNVSISSIVDIRELFIENYVLHAVAKIAYEWHCYINKQDEYDPEKYQDIVSYILTPESTDAPVEIVVDNYAWIVMDNNSRTGSNVLFEYHDIDGYTYVVFGLWGVILYKVRICRYWAEISMTNQYNAYYYHVDGSKDIMPFATVGPPRFASDSPEKGLSYLCSEIKQRLSALGERDLSKLYIKNCVDKIKPLLPKYKSGKCSLAELLDFEAKDRVVPVHILELLLSYKDEYNPSESFNENMIRILKTNDRYVMTDAKKEEILQRYAEMDKHGTFYAMLNAAIDFFEAQIICMKQDE